MKYIIMCGGEYKAFDTPKQLLKVFDEVIVERTIRQLKENGVKDIAISTNNPAFDYLDVPKLRHTNTFVHEYGNEEAKGWWLDAFYPYNKPVCYIWGDVYFSDDAIKKIVNTRTDDIELFGSMPPFSPDYYKQWIEPFALKVQDTKHLWASIQKTKELALEGKTWRKNPIVWELWTIIKGLPLEERPNEYVYNYTAINDYTSDIDNQQDINQLENILIKKGGNYMVKLEVVEGFTLGRFNELTNITRMGADVYGLLNVGDTFECNDDLAKYLLGENAHQKPFVKVIEVIPEPIKEEVKEEPKKEVKPKTTRLKRRSTK